MSVAPAPIRPEGERTCPVISAGGRGVVLDLHDLGLGPFVGAEILGVFPANDKAQRKENTQAKEWQPSVVWMEETSGTLPHRLRICGSGGVADVNDENSSAGASAKLWIALLNIKSSEREADFPLALVISENANSIMGDAGAVSGQREMPPQPHPVPVELDPALSRADGAFVFDGLAPGEVPAPESLLVLCGNEPVFPQWEELASRTNSSPQGNGKSNQDKVFGHKSLYVEWPAPDRVVVRGLRDCAASRRSDAIVRVYAQTSAGRWIASGFAFGGRGRRLFEPRDAVLYSVLVDRLASRNSADAAAKDAVNSQWTGGDSSDVRRLLKSGRLGRLGANCLVLSPIFRQAPLPGAYHGYWTATFMEPEPRLGTTKSWQKTIREAHGEGISVMLSICPWIVHGQSDLAAEKPEWFSSPADKDPRLQISKSAAGNPQGNEPRLDEQPDFTDLRAPFLRCATFAENTEAVERMTGYGIGWLRILNADGLWFAGSDGLSEAFWRRQARRIRGEVAGPEGRGVYLLGEPFGTPGAPGAPQNEDENSQFATMDLGSLDGRTDNALSLALRGVLLENRGSMAGLNRLARQSAREFSGGEIPCATSGSPWMARWRSVAQGNGRASDSSELLADARLDLAMCALLTFPAVPAIYYGDEIGLEGAQIPENRAPMPDEQDWTARERRRFARTGALGALRRESPALRRGDYQTLFASKDVLVFARAAWSEAMLVAINRGLGESQAEIEIPGNLRGASQAQLLWRGGMKQPLSSLPSTPIAPEAESPKSEVRFMGARLHLRIPPQSACVYRIR